MQVFYVTSVGELRVYILGQCTKLCAFHVLHYTGLSFKNECCATLALLKIFRCAVGGHFYVYNFTRFWCAESRTCQSHF